MKQFVFLLAACACPYGFLSAVSADESQPIALTADEIVQEKEVTVSSADSDDLADSDDVSVKSEISITATVTSAEELAKVWMNGKIVVVGPDGKRQEFAISGNEAGKVFKIVTGEEVAGNADQQASHSDFIVRVLKEYARETGSDGEPVSESRLAIGVHCEDVPDALRSHLDLAEKGIMVDHVREKSPASEAALMKFDIILQIGDKDVASACP